MLDFPTAEARIPVALLDAYPEEGEKISPTRRLQMKPKRGVSFPTSAKYPPGSAL